MLLPKTRVVFTYKRETATFLHTFLFIDEELGGATIAAIVLGIVIVIGVVVGLVAFYLYRQNRRKAESTPDSAFTNVAYMNTAPPTYLAPTAQAAANDNDYALLANGKEAFQNGNNDFKYLKEQEAFKKV